MPSPIVLTAAKDLKTETTSELFRGTEYGVDVSFFINHTRPGATVEPHRHPYGEVFVLRAGELEFTVDGESVTASAGQVVVVPAGAIHGFHNAGDEVAEMLSIHPVAQMQTEWVEES